ncbi:MAG: AbrB/MazE/SpoVT family DNA-binding domain-containing protein, partial [Nanoarchaeota archaeon]|nr:AbrB/MazE/SpoVT family DNA-binding domain-containing protein [Nanoarchaeota archaeon]
MEYRKLISFGKSSFVVSLPKSWVIQNKLKKGDLIYMEENEGTLILGAKEHESTEDKSTIILTDG